MNEQAAQPDAAIHDAEGWEWMMVEIFGHRQHWGRGKEVERFGTKMLRIDIPQIRWSQPTEERPESVAEVESWVSMFYGGASIFSNALTDEATVMKRNMPSTWDRPLPLIAPPVADSSADDNGGLWERDPMEDDRCLRLR